MLHQVSASAKKTFRASLFLVSVLLAESSFAQELIRINSPDFKDPRCMTAFSVREKRRARCDRTELPSHLIISNTNRVSKRLKYPDPDYKYDSKLGGYKKYPIHRRSN